MGIVTIVGLLQFDSGKTRFTTRLLRYLARVEPSIHALKPIGSHSVWGQEFSLYYSIEHGVLVGGDAIRIARSLGGVRPESVELMDILLAPPDSARYASRLRDYVLLHEDLLGQAVAFRYTRCRGEGLVEYVHVFSLEKLAGTPPALARMVSRLYESVKSRGGMVSTVEPGALARMLTSPEVYSQVDQCARMVSGKTRILVIESFNDALVPTPLALESRVFLAVSPGRVVVYNGSSVARAVNTLAPLKRGVARSSDVLSHVKPLEVFELEYAGSDDAPGRDVESIAGYILKLLEA